MIRVRVSVKVRRSLSVKVRRSLSVKVRVMFRVEAWRRAKCRSMPVD